MPTSAKNFGVTKLELTGLLVNIHGFIQLLHSQYFEVLVDHKAIEHVVKSKTETPKHCYLLLKLSKYTVVLLPCGCISLIPFIEFMNLEFGTTHQVQMC